jgi:histone H3/H4
MGWQDAPEVKASPAWASAPEVNSTSMGGKIAKGLGNLAAGAIRGAGSIGATLLAPIDVASDAMAGKGLSLESNRQRRATMDAGLQELGADPDSLLYKGGKLAGEIAGTAGAGGAVANAAGRAVPSLAPNLLTSIRTAGMSAGGATGVANPLMRVAGGAVSGGASAALVDPEQAGAGAAIGAAAPFALQAAGKAGNALGKVLRGPEQSADVATAIQAARASGYVIPPTQARPTLGNRLLEGFSGKITTAQNASAKNQAVTNAKAAEALGLAADTKITPDVLKTVRDQAGQAYQAIGSTGTVQPTQAYADALDKIAAPFIKTSASFPNAKPSPVLELVDSLKSPTFDAAAAVEKIKQLRSGADDAFRTGSTDVGRASRSAASALEDALEQHLQQIGQPELLQAFKDGRKLIAKTYSVEKALNPATGSIDAKKLAAQAEKGKPLSSELKEVADFAARFPKAAQTIEQMGSLPQTSPLDWAAAGTISAATANPLLLASAMARPAARSLTLSPVVQNRLIQPSANPIAALLGPRAAEFSLRASPIALTDR